jgi:hypothetical protein
MYMTKVYLAHDSVISEQEKNNISYMVSAARECNCDLCIAQDDKTVETIEGYWSFRYLVSAASETNMETFLKKIAKQTGFLNWYPVTEAYYQEANQFLGRRMPTLNEWAGHSNHYSSWLEGIGSHIRDNQRLRKLLETRSPIFFEYDWLVPNIELEALSDLKTLIEASYYLDTGTGLHIGRSWQTDTGSFTQNFAIRVLEIGELAKFVSRTNHMMQLEDWKPITPNIFQNSVTIALFMTERSLKSAVVEMSRANAASDLG